MLYTILYYDENGKRTWIKCSSLDKANEICKEYSPLDAEICVSLYEYEKAIVHVDALKSVMHDAVVLLSVN